MRFEYWFSNERNRIVESENHIKVLDDTLFNSDVGVFVTFGQSNALNDSELGYQVKGQVFMQYLGGVYEFEEPTIGGTGNLGNPWGRLGDLLIDNGVYDKVVFSLSGESGKSIKELTSYPNINFLIRQYNASLELFGKVDGVLFHQGESDHTNLHYEYYLKKIWKKLEEIDPKVKIFVSITSYCRGELSRKLTLQQINIVDEVVFFHGPNSDLLIDDRFRMLDRCHFSKNGLDVLSGYWFSSIIGRVNK